MDAHTIRIHDNWQTEAEAQLLFLWSWNWKLFIAYRWCLKLWSVLLGNQIKGWRAGCCDNDPQIIHTVYLMLYFKMWTPNLNRIKPLRLLLSSMSMSLVRMMKVLMAESSVSCFSFWLNQQREMTDRKESVKLWKSLLWKSSFLSNTIMSCSVSAFVLVVCWFSRLVLFLPSPRSLSLHFNNKSLVSAASPPLHCHMFIKIQDPNSSLICCITNLQRHFIEAKQVVTHWSKQQTN